MNTLTLPALSDYHLHARQGATLAQVAPYSQRCCGRVLLMPNTVQGDGLRGPIATATDVEDYRRQVTPHFPGVDVLLTIKLLESTTPEVIREAWRVGAVAAKLYPRGATTHAQDGIPTEWLEVKERIPGTGALEAQFKADNRSLLDCLAEMERLGVVLCLHGEIPHYSALADHGSILTPPTASSAFLDFLRLLPASFPNLKIVLEHITTRLEVDFVQFWHAKTEGRIAATITPHHLLLTIEDVVGRKLYPHHFCLPVAKFASDRQALVDAATSGHPAFFLGSDSAPHPVSAKECHEGCAGVFNAPVLIETLCEVFEDAGALDKLPFFLARDGDRFYKSMPSGRKITLVRESWRVPDRVGRDFRPFRAGQRLR